VDAMQLKNVTTTVSESKNAKQIRKVDSLLLDIEKWKPKQNCGCRYN
jgi:hypothetical protein